MKLFTATTVIVSTLLALSATLVQALQTEDEAAPFYFTLGAAGGGCIGLKDATAARGDRLTLRSCSLTDDSILWTVDEESRFRNKLGMDMCVQAGVTDSVPTSGTDLRMVPCGVSDLQKFDLSDFSSDGSFFGPIKPESSSGLCMVHRGPNANIDADPIVLKPCEMLDADRAQGWEAEFRDEEALPTFFTFNAPGGGCIGLKNGSAHRGSQLMLRTCSQIDDSLQWSLGEDNRFHSKLNMTMCIQAGVSGSTPAGGTTMRVVPCGVSDLQIFDVSGVTPVSDTVLQGPIKPMASLEYCMVHRGPTAHVDSDPIFLKKCHILSEDRAAGFMIEFVVDGPV